MFVFSWTVVLCFNEIQCLSLLIGFFQSFPRGEKRIFFYSVFPKSFILPFTFMIHFKYVFYASNRFCASSAVKAMMHLFSMQDLLLRRPRTTVRRNLQWPGIVREFGVDMYTLLYLNWITNEDLLYSTGNSAQCYVATRVGGASGKEWMHVYVWLSPFAVHLKFSQHFVNWLYSSLI